MAKLNGKDVLNTNFFEEDLNTFNDQINKTEKLYDEVHDLYEQATGGEGATFKMMRDASELAKTLSSIRSTSIDAINKRFQMKRSVSDFEQKKQQMNKENENASEIARATVAAIRNSSEKIISDNNYSEQSRENLKNRLTEAFDNNEIILSDNERAMSLDFKGVEIVFRKSDNKFIAINKTGEIIENYPEERILDRNIVKEENNEAITSTGGRYRII